MVGDSTSQSIVRLLGIALGAMFVAALTTLAVSIIADRLDRAEIVIAPAELDPVVAQIGGAVGTPGVYELPAQARLADLVHAAGGLATDADVATLNLAARIGDGEAVTVPRTLAVIAGTPAPAEPVSADADTGLVNINTATLAELEALPRIGPVLGQRIIDEREQLGAFTAVDDLSRIEGISDTMVDTLRPLVTIDG